MISCLVKEIELRKKALNNQIVETIYFGGGTPSMLSAKEISLLIAAVYKHHTVVSSPEITLEANPDDLSELTNKTMKKIFANIHADAMNYIFGAKLRRRILVALDAI